MNNKHHLHKMFDTAKTLCYTVFVLSSLRARADGRNSRCVSVTGLLLCLLDTGPGDDGSPLLIGQATSATRSVPRATDTNKEG